MKHIRCQCVILLFVMITGTAAAQNFLSVPPLALEYYHQGVFYGKQVKYVEAIMALEKAIEAYPDYADAYNALGVVYHRQQEYQEAIEQYMAAIEINPEHVKARTNLALVYNDQEQYQNALQQLEQAVRIDPTYSAAQRLLGDVREKIGDEPATLPEQEHPQAAEQRVTKQQTARQQPSSSSVARSSSSVATPRPKKSAPPAPRSFFQRGTELVKQDKLDEGIAEYRKGLQQEPHSVEGYTLLGMAYREKFRRTDDFTWQEQELAAFQKAVQTDPTYVPAILALGETLYARRDYSNAALFFKAVLRYEPNHPAREQIEQLLKR